MGDPKTTLHRPPRIKLPAWEKRALKSLRLQCSTGPFTGCLCACALFLAHRNHLAHTVYRWGMIFFKLLPLLLLLKCNFLWKTLIYGNYLKKIVRSKNVEYELTLTLQFYFQPRWLTRIVDEYEQWNRAYADRWTAVLHTQYYLLSWAKDSNQNSFHRNKQGMHLGGEVRKAKEKAINY